MSKKDNTIVWCDLEFTHPNPCVGEIMQIAMLVTEADLTPIYAPGHEDGLEFDLKVSEQAEASATPFVLEKQGALLAECRGANATRPCEAEDQLVSYVLNACTVATDGIDDQDERDNLKKKNPVIAGNSVHGDLAMLRMHMRDLEALLSYRVLDVTAFKVLRERWYDSTVQKFDKYNQDMMEQWLPKGIQRSGKKHNALFDVKASIAELNYYRSHLLK